jgi:hypothetical protein
LEKRVKNRGISRFLKEAQLVVVPP